MTVTDAYQSTQGPRSEQRTMCKGCGAPLPDHKVTGPNRHKILYCSDRCKRSQSTPARREIPLATGSVGALSELLVSCDLITRGWYVFRALSPSSPCDLIVTRGGNLIRIEVRTGSLGILGFISCPFTEKDFGRSDAVAIVVDDQSIMYYPDFFTGGPEDAVLPSLSPSTKGRLTDAYR